MILLFKPHWTAKNISTYTGFGLTKSYEIMAVCRKKYGGTIPDLPSCVSRESVMAYLGTTTKKEIEIFKERRKGNK